MKPFAVTVWRAGYVTVGTFASFPEALSCYRGIVSDTTAQLVNQDRAECGRDGLTDEERDAVAEVANAADRSKGAA